MRRLATVLTWLMIVTIDGLSYHSIKHFLTR